MLYTSRIPFPEAILHTRFTDTTAAAVITTTGTSLVTTANPVTYHLPNVIEREWVERSRCFHIRPVSFESSAPQRLGEEHRPELRLMGKGARIHVICSG
jgi:hypothetical protein